MTKHSEHMGGQQQQHVLRRAVASALALVVGLVASVLVSIPLASPAAADLVSDETALLESLNSYRETNGRGFLARDPRADDVARAWARTMSNQQRLQHNPDLSGQITRQVTNQWSAFGEVITAQSSAAAAHWSFVSSPPHRAHLLGDYNRVGIGAARDGAGRLWVSIVFVRGPAFTAPSETWKPFDTVYRLVEQQYRDFLNRAPDASGGSYWQMQLFGGGMPPSALIKAMLMSGEFAGTGGGVARLQLAYFQRPPDQPTFARWFDHLRAGGSLSAVSDAFAKSGEFSSAYGSLSNSAFVDKAYRTVLGRVPDAGGASDWTGKLNRGEASRADVMLALSESSEHRARRDADVLVAMTYFGMLRRSPDAGGYDYWVRAVRGGTSIQTLVSQFLVSPEYRSRRF